MKKCALVFDQKQSDDSFPSDYMAEWETEETVFFLKNIWEELGYEVILMPFNRHFFDLWIREINSITIVHSVLEGWGSISREAWIPSLCELSGIPYIGSDPLAQSVCMKKSLLKLICRSLSIPTADFYLITQLADLDLVPLSFFAELHFIKPDAEGSGMGILGPSAISHNKKNTFEIVKEQLNLYPDGILLESYLEGDEYTCALIGSPLKALSIAHISVSDGVYGLAHKGKDYMGEKVSFPFLDEKVRKIILDGSHLLSKTLNVKDFIRLDWKINQFGIPCFLEANPLAGLSYFYSVLPKMAEHDGISYKILIETIEKSAISRINDRKYLYGQARVLGKKS